MFDYDAWKTTPPDEWYDREFTRKAEDSYVVFLTFADGRTWSEKCDQDYVNDTIKGIEEDPESYTDDNVVKVEIFDMWEDVACSYGSCEEEYYEEVLTSGEDELIYSKEF